VHDICTIIIRLHVLQMPSYEWAATTGKKYSLMFVDLMQPSVPRGVIIRYFAYNVCNGTTVTKDLDTTFGAWRAPMLGHFGSTNGLSVHLLFEHATELDFNRSAALEIAGLGATTDLATFMAAVGLNAAKLVSSSWMTVRDSIMNCAPMGVDRCERK
jgi:hypothetical protein